MAAACCPPRSSSPGGVKPREQPARVSGTELIEDGWGRDRYCRHSARQREGWSGGRRYHSGDWARRYRSEPSKIPLQIDCDRIYEPYGQTWVRCDRHPGRCGKSELSQQ
jgi:hypothetical protein